MPDETSSSDRKTELQTLLHTEYRKWPWLMYCTLACIGLLVAGFILNIVLQGRVHVSTQCYIVTLVYLVGAVAGAFGLFTAPQSMREHQKPLRWATVLNAGFFLFFGYRALVLLQLHGS